MGTFLSRSLFIILFVCRPLLRATRGACRLFLVLRAKQYSLRSIVQHGSQSMDDKNIPSIYQISQYDISIRRYQSVWPSWKELTNPLQLSWIWNHKKKKCPDRVKLEYIEGCSRYDTKTRDTLRKFLKIWKVQPNFPAIGKYYRNIYCISTKREKLPYY